MDLRRHHCTCNIKGVSYSSGLARLPTMWRYGDALFRNPKCIKRSIQNKKIFTIILLLLQFAPLNLPKLARIPSTAQYAALLLLPALQATRSEFGALKDEVKSTATKFLVEIFKLVVFCVGSAK